MTALRWVSWAAVSSEPQVKDKVSIDDQLNVNREHCAHHGGQLVAELVVPGQSRNIVLFEEACRRIDAYARLKELIDQKAFDVLVFLNRSRLGRKASLSMAVVELCHESGIVTFETENPPATLAVPQTSHDDMLLGAIKSVGAQREIQQLTERHRMGMLGRIKRGELPSRVPYGYIARFDEHGTRSIEIDEAAASVIQRIFAEYLAGSGTPVIADRLNADGIPTPLGRRWESINVRSILDNIWRYAGMTEVNRRSKRNRPYVRAPGNWPAIITVELAERIVAERQQRRAHRRLANTTYLLSGLCWCMRCNRRMHVRSQAPKRPNQRRVEQIVCTGPHDQRSVSYKRIVSVLRSRIAELKHFDRDELTGANTMAESLAGQIEQQLATLNDLAARIQRADDAYVAGRMDAARYGRQVEQIEMQRITVETEIDRLRQLLADDTARGTHRQRLEETATAGLAMLDHPDPAVANIWLRNHVRIWIDGYSVAAVEWI